MILYQKHMWCCFVIVEGRTTGTILTKWGELFRSFSSILEELMAILEAAKSRATARLASHATLSARKGNG